MKVVVWALGSVMLFTLGACGGGGGGTADSGSTTPPAPTANHALKGSVSGLSAEGLTLANGAETLVIASGSLSFTFAQGIAEGASYAVSVKTQPNGQVCTLSNGSGTMGSTDVTNVSVSCSTPHLLKGSVIGLISDGLVLANGSDEIVLASGSTAFTFPRRVAERVDYSVTIKTQPPGQGCAVANGFGTVGTSDIENVVVTCTTLRYTLGGTIENLNASGLIIADGQDRLTLVAGQKSFTFAATRPYGTAYSVNVVQQPVGQNCAVAKGSGVTTEDTSSVAVSCVASLLPGAENRPTLAAPQPGSTAAVGNGLEGSYVDLFGTYLFIASDGTYVRRAWSGMAFGKISSNAGTWKVESGFYSPELGNPNALSGSGTFTAFRTVSGTDSGGAVSHTFDSSNALAVEQNELQGQWSTDDGAFDISLDATGRFTGTTSGTAFGACNVGGMVTSADPGTKKNVFRVAMTASGGTACKLSLMEYSGLANVDLYAVTSTPANGYKRYLILAMSPNNGNWLRVTVKKR